MFSEAAIDQFLHYSTHTSRALQRPDTAGEIYTMNSQQTPTSKDNLERQAQDSGNPLDWRLRSVDHHKYLDKNRSFKSLRRFIANIRGDGASEKDSAEPLPELEKHHSYNGRPWCLGLDHFDYLVSRGLSPDDQFLDIGCGALRTGIHLIDFLEPEHYFGIDAHGAAIEVAKAYEIPLNRLEAKSPRLLCDSGFNLEKCQTKFDWVFAFAVVNHLDDALFHKAFTSIRSVMNSGGKLVLSPKPRISLETIREEHGFELINEEVRPCRLTNSEIHWFEFALVDE